MTNMKEKKLKKTITIRVEAELLEKYKQFCDDNGFTYSKRLRLLMKKDIVGKIRIIK